MWRSGLSWRGTIDECKKKFGCVPPGAWMFIVKNDGGEKKRGYNDEYGNACHVAIYTGLAHPESWKAQQAECRSAKIIASSHMLGYANMLILDIIKMKSSILIEQSSYVMN